MGKGQDLDQVEKSILEIDINSLDKEWVDQPSTFFRYARKLADARMDYEEAKAELDITRAELDKAIRDDPDGYGCTKLTETSIENCILTQGQYQKARSHLSNCKHRVDVLQAYVTAFDHRKSALERLVQLHGQSYFATPNASGEHREHMEDVEKRSIRGSGKKRSD